MFNCAAQSVDGNGLHLTCQYTPGVGHFYGSTQNYTCGALTSVGHASGYRFFQFKPGQGQEWAIQAVAKWPQNTGEADPGWWSADPPWTQELDFFEGFGGDAGPGGTWCHATSGNGWIGSTLPTWIYQTSPLHHIAGSEDICRNLGFDQSAGYHTYTTVIRPDNTVSEYIDGKPLAWDYVGGLVPGSGGTVLAAPPFLSNATLGLELSYAMRGPTGNPDPWFKSGVRSFDFRSVSVYENATAGGANTVNPGVAPGTAVVP